MVTKETIARFKVSRINYTCHLPAGLRVKPVDPLREPGVYFLDQLPEWLFPINSFERHDAYYYGVRLYADQIQKDPVEITRTGKITMELK